MVMVLEAGFGDVFTKKAVRLLTINFLEVIAVPQEFVFVTFNVYWPTSPGNLTFIGLPEKFIGKLSDPTGGVNTQE